MRLVVTDVTEMHHGNYCVAGWSAERNAMVRPLPSGANWTDAMLANHQVALGSTIDFQPTGRPGTGIYPHLTEDTPVERAAIRFVAPGPIRWFGPNAPPVAPTLDDAFGGALRWKDTWEGSRYGVEIPARSEVPSLGAVSLDRRQLRFFKDDYGKLRAVLDDGSASYQLPVSSKALKEAFRVHGLERVERICRHPGTLHVRVGLARPYDRHPDKCYVMLNGVQW